MIDPVWLIPAFAAGMAAQGLLIMFIMWLQS